MDEPRTRRAHLARTMAIVTASSMLVPLGGLVTAPVLARALSTSGRGELAAALAPSSLMLAAATLGLPDALTFVVARWPARTRRSVLVAAVVTLALALACLGLTTAFAPLLASGRPALAGYIVLATVLTVPALVVGTLRGAATGAQMWTEIVWERVLLLVLRVGLLGGLYLSGHLTVPAALVVSAIVPWVAGLVYIRVLLGQGGRRSAEPERIPPASELLRTLTTYGSKVWLGSVAGMLLARVSSLLMVPLAGTSELGLYAVAVTVSDVPVIAVFTVQGVLFSVSSRSADPDEVTAVSRLSLTVAVLGCSVMAALTPLVIGPLFGDEFRDATVPTVVLLLSAVISVPGLLCSSGVSAWGRPGLRSLGFVVALVTNVIAFVLLVPPLGALGAALASVAANAAMTTVMLLIARRLLGFRTQDALVPKHSDLARLRAAVRLPTRAH